MGVRIILVFWYVLFIYYLLLVILYMKIFWLYMLLIFSFWGEENVFWVIRFDIIYYMNYLYII